MREYYLSYDLYDNVNLLKLDDPLAIADVLVFNKVYDFFKDELYFSDTEKNDSRSHFIYYPSERACTKIIKDLPVISVSRKDVKLAGDKDTYIASSQARKLKFNIVTKKISGQERKSFEILSEVMPITLSYNISFWSRYISDLNRVLLSLNQKFGKTRIIPIPLDYFLYYDSVEKRYRPMSTFLTIDTSPITSDFQEPANGERLIQISFGLKYEYYYLAKTKILPYNKIIVDLILSNFDKVFVYDKNEVIDTFTINKKE